MGAGVVTLSTLILVQDTSDLHPGCQHFPDGYQLVPISLLGHLSFPLSLPPSPPAMPFISGMSHLHFNSGLRVFLEEPR